MVCKRRGQTAERMKELVEERIQESRQLYGLRGSQRRGRGN